ncbi:MAG: hypothetical protein ACWA44_06015 [Thiotrichales bacterium]
MNILDLSNLKTGIHTIAIAFILQSGIAGTVIADTVKKPEIRNISDQASHMLLSGTGFGEPCARCEVIAHYSQSIKYALPIVSWSDSGIKARLPDLNQPGTNVKVSVTTKNGNSRPKSLRLKRKVSLSLRMKKTHSLSVGDKGEDLFDIPGARLACDQQTSTFDHAEVKVRKSRFAEARIVKSPPAGCTECSPIVVRWYNEPTGSLSYDLLVFSRNVEGICKDRLR